MGNTLFWNKWFYIQRWYDYTEDNYIWRFWILGWYFDTEKDFEDEYK